MAKPPGPPYPPRTPFPKTLLCVGGPLAGKMRPIDGHTLVAEEMDPDATGMDKFFKTRRVCYRVVTFRCGLDDNFMWTCLNDGDTLAELMNFYGTNKERLSSDDRERKAVQS